MDLSGATEQAQELAMQSIAERCKYDLFFFAKHILGYSEMQEHVHQDMCQYVTPVLPGDTPLDYTPLYYKPHASHPEFEDKYDPENRNVLILMPRGTFKTSVVTIGLSLQYLLNDPDARILLDSETFAKSKAFLSEIKGHIENNQRFRDVFYHIYGVMPDRGKKKVMLWSDSQINLACRTKHRKEPSISCAGIDVTKTGMHYDLIIADDLHSEKNVTSSEQIQQVIEHIQLAYSLLDPGKPLVAIGTRWDYADAYQHIIDNYDDFNLIVRDATDNGSGGLLFPEVLTRKELDDLRKKQSSYIFSCQYRNMPVDDETAEFKASYFRHKPWKLVEDKPINWFMSVDPSEAGAHSDYAAFILAGIDTENELYVRNAHNAKMQYADIVNLMFDWYHKYQPRAIALETVATQKTISHILHSEQKRRGVWLPVHEIRARNQKKEERIRTLVPYYEFGRAWHIKECNYLKDLEDQLTHFPRAKHDDLPDALANIIEIAYPPNRRRAHKQERKTKSSDVYKPRSPITGV